MLDYTMDDARRDHMARMEAKMFAPGAFVMLHHARKVDCKPHEDAGRIGRIVSRNGDRMVTEFWSDDLIGGATFSLIPLGHWAPVPEFCVEEYEPRAKRRGVSFRPAKLCFYAAYGRDAGRFVRSRRRRSHRMLLRGLI